MKWTFAMLALLLSAVAALPAVAATPESTPMKSADSIMMRMGYVDVAASDPSIAVELMYATDRNFVGSNMYVEGPTRAWLHPDAAKALLKAAAELKRTNPQLRLKVCDASRPMSAQKRMYRTVRGTAKAPYVSNPANGGGLHNYGLAVDVTLIDAHGRELPMGTPVDHLGREANIDREEQLVARGVITAAERDNRMILRRVMKAGGFKPLRSEWWHFNLVGRSEARRRYKLLDF